MQRPHTIFKMAARKSRFATAISLYFALWRGGERPKWPYGHEDRANEVHNAKDNEMVGRAGFEPA